MYKGLFGKSYISANKLGSGGEGDIFQVSNDASIAMKIYHSNAKSSEIEKKIIMMVNNPPHKDVLNQVTWPLDALYDEKGEFTGYVMPKLSFDMSLEEIYEYPSPKQIEIDKKILIGQNICAVIDAVHRAGYVFGDFNPRNIRVNSVTCEVAFMDTDSYHIVLNKEQNLAYRCKVCADGYVAPELLEKCFKYKEAHQNGNAIYENVELDTFTTATDYFALAIHIFKLTMNGFTPFNGIKEVTSGSVSVPAPSIGNMAIINDEYCFKKGNKPLAVAVPTAKDVPTCMMEMFNRAFVEGRKHPENRPNAIEWYNALEEYRMNLVRCRHNKEHLYHKDLDHCPWCDTWQKYQEKINGAIASVSPDTVPDVLLPPKPSAPLYDGIYSPKGYCLIICFYLLAQVCMPLFDSSLVGIYVIFIIVYGFIIGMMRNHYKKPTELYSYLGIASLIVYFFPIIIPVITDQNQTYDFSEYFWVALFFVIFYLIGRAVGKKNSN